MSAKAYKDKEGKNLVYARNLTREDQGKTYYCFDDMCRCRMRLVVFDAEPDKSYFASDKHEEGCSQARPGKRKKEDTGNVRLNFETMLQKDTGDKQDGGDGGGGIPPIVPPEIDPFNTKKTKVEQKDPVIIAAGSMYNLLHDKNLYEEVDGYIVDDILYDERNMMNKLRTSAMEGVHLILLKRCNPKDAPFNVPEEYACFKDILTTNPKKASYFLVKLGNSKHHSRFRASCFSKKTRDKYKYVGVFGDWKKYEGVDYPYVYYVDMIKNTCKCFVK